MEATTSEDGRLITIDSYDDGGLSSGVRKIQIYLPADYERNEVRYPVLYFTDGGSVFSANRPDMLVVDKVLDELVEKSAVVPAIIVAIFNSSVEGRVKDLSPFADSGYTGHSSGIGGEGGGLDGFYRMIVECLKPSIDGQFRTDPGPEATGIIGISLGGLAAFTLAYDHPETFGMAGCLSSSFWWADRFTIRRVVDDAGKPKTRVRFWIDGGGGEYGMWQDAHAMSMALERRGWILGEDLGLYFDYKGDHDWPAFAARIPDVLRFLLRTRRPDLIGHRVVSAVDSTAEVMDLSRRQRSIVGVEALYSDETRLTVVSPSLSADPRVAVVDTSDPFLVRPIGLGETFLRSTFRGFEASLRIQGGDRLWPTEDIEFIETPPSNFPHEIVRDGETIARFAVTYDSAFLRVEVHTVDSNVQVDAEKQPWEQTTTQILLDSRPVEILTKASGYDHDDIEQTLVLSMCPSQSGVPAVLNSMGLTFESNTSEWDKVMPSGAQVACGTEVGGYYTTLSIPVDYLDAKQDGQWKHARVNIMLQRVEESGDLRTYDWQPGWTIFDTPIGTGIFYRQS